MSETKTLDREQVTETLRRVVWEAAQRIGHPDKWDCPPMDTTLGERKFYADGIKLVVTHLAESFDIDDEILHLKQLPGAMGEWQQRSTPGVRPFRDRALNNCIIEIRAMRVRIFDDFILVNFGQVVEWQKRFLKIERKDKSDREAQDVFWSECQQVHTELNAIRELNVLLTTDKGWWQEHCRLSEITKQIVANIQVPNWAHQWS